MADGELDIVVIGGGITGAGAALDAANRGLSVGLVEAQDWAAGTSSRSSKLIHGGLRYLEQLHLGLVREALRERTLLLTRLAPHLVRPVSFVYPLRHGSWERAYVGSGVLLYDLMAGAQGAGRASATPRHRHLSRRETLELAPALRPGGLRGAIRYSDAQVDDARYTLAVVRTAAAEGAKVASRAKVVGFLRRGAAVCGVVVRDEEAGVDVEIRARAVVCASGVWTPDLQAEAGVSGGLEMRASKGVHLVLARESLTLETGLIVRAEESVLLVIPWGGHWIVGTTDTAWGVGREDPRADARDVDYLLEHLNAALTTDISPGDVVATYAGLRPLVAGKAASTAKLSRKHSVARPAPGLTVVAGGKFTTYRVMAADAVDAAVSQLGAGARPSRSADVPLVGAGGFAAMWAARAEMAGRAGITVEVVEHLLRRYGGLSGELLELMAADASLAAAIPGAGDYLLAEAAYGASHEGALHLADVLERRTRTAIEHRDRGIAAAESVAATMGAALGWSPAVRDDEVARYRRRAAAEIAAQGVSGDDGGAPAGAGETRAPAAERER